MIVRLRPDRREARLEGYFRGEFSLFEAILVGADESPAARRAVDVAVQMAKRFACPLHIVAAFSPKTYHRSDGSPRREFENLNHEDDADALLQVLSFSAKSEGVEPVLHAVRGELVDALVETGKTLNVDLVVVGNAALTGARRILGSSASAVAHGVHCSVLIVDSAT